MRGRQHSREFKFEVVREVVSGAKRPAQVCRERELSEGLLLRWRKEYEMRGEAAFGPPLEGEKRALERRVDELERFCGQLALENAVLKKALRGSPSRNGTP